MSVVLSMKIVASHKVSGIGRGTRCKSQAVFFGRNCQRRDDNANNMYGVPVGMLLGTGFRQDLAIFVPDSTNCAAASNCGFHCALPACAVLITASAVIVCQLGVIG